MALDPQIKDGIFITRTKWKIDRKSLLGNTTVGGIIIQRINFVWDIKEECNAGAKALAGAAAAVVGLYKEVDPNDYYSDLVKAGNFKTENYPYLEAWQYDRGANATAFGIQNGQYDDQISTQVLSRPNRKTIGKVIITAEARLYENIGIPSGFRQLFQPPAGSLHVMLGVKGNDDSPLPGAKFLVYRTWAITWDAINGDGTPKIASQSSSKSALTGGLLRP